MEFTLSKLIVQRHPVGQEVHYLHPTFPLHLITNASALARGNIEVWAEMYCFYWKDLLKLIFIEKDFMKSILLRTNTKVFSVHRADFDTPEVPDRSQYPIRKYKRLGRAVIINNENFVEWQSESQERM